jgi:predicted RNA-binding protein with PUA-like domain
MIKEKRNILLLEPNYKNKYPPIGLMKLATYHRMLGDNVIFFKGDLKEFILDNIYDELKSKLFDVDSSILWDKYVHQLRDYLKKGNRETLENLSSLSKYKLLVENWLIFYKDYYRKKEYLENPKWDRVCITTLFTFHWKITIETINFAKKLVKDPKQVFIGGVLATVLADDVEKETGVKTHKGLLNLGGELDDNKIIIDELPLDYSILDEIDYKYPENDAYYGYMTRGCIRKCSFCAVWKIEPEFLSYISLKNKIKETNKVYSDQRNLLLLDNNVLASKKFPQIINEIKDSGFVKGAMFISPNYLEIAVRNLRNGINDKAYINKSFEQLHYLLNRLQGSRQQNLYNLLEEFKLLNKNTATKENVLKIYPEVKQTYENFRNKIPKRRYVDFNQGLDARLLTEEKMQMLSEIPIKPLRIAFDSMKYEKIYVRAVELAAKYKIRHLSNYLLYNEKDTPEELYQRLKINVELSDKYDLQIYSFPMKYHPIEGAKYKDRSFLGENWNRKFIRAVQTVLNSTKGKIGKGTSFFNKAFGQDLEEFFNILYMPETYILYRRFFEYSGRTEKWQSDFSNFSRSKKENLKSIIESNDFVNLNTNDKEIIGFIKKHYSTYREEIQKDPNSAIFKEKAEFDKLDKEEKLEPILKSLIV